MALPFLACAQNPNLFSDFQKGVDEISSFKVNDKINVISTASNHKSFDLIAIDEQMHIVWQTNLKGNSLVAGKFKNEIIAVASTDYSTMKGGINNTYTGYILDPASGKVVAEKIIYQDNDNYKEEPTFFIDPVNAEYFKLLVRRSAVERRIHGSFGPLAIFALARISKQARTTTGLTAIEFNERLEPVNTFTPEISSDYILDTDCSKLGNLLITGYDGNGNIEVAKYNFGDPKPIAKLKQTVDLLKSDPDNFGGSIITSASKDNNNIIYVGLYGRNSNKDDQLNLIKFDFAAQKTQLLTDIYNKPRIKGLEKAYQTINKECDDAQLRSSDKLSIRYLQEKDNHLVVVLSTREATSFNNTFAYYEYTNIITGYDNELRMKFQQLLPVNYRFIGQYLPLSYRINNDKLYSIGNFGNTDKIKGLYSVLNLTTGNWEKMTVLSKEKLAKKSFTSGNVLWYSNTYVVPYLELKGLFSRSYTIDLQKNTM
ncbi:hypothetical protein GCM10027037_31040 [Mucilaginibacter koreensis]